MNGHNDRRTFPLLLRLEAGLSRGMGRGPRQCLGEGFAWMEGLLVLATLAQTWRMQRVPGPPVAPWGLVTLRPKAGIPMHLARRGPRGATPPVATGPGEAG